MKMRGLAVMASGLAVLGVSVPGAFPGSFPPAVQVRAAHPDLNAAALDGCRIKVLSVYFWRDWMPIVSRPGEDRGSPLYTKVALSFDNSKGEAIRLSYSAKIIDEKGQTFPVSFEIQPDYKILPRSAAETYANLDEKGKRDLLAKYRAIWDGALMPGTVRDVEFLSHNGPYLPVGGRVQVEFAFTDEKGRSATVRTPVDIINRTN